VTVLMMPVAASATTAPASRLLGHNKKTIRVPQSSAPTSEKAEKKQDRLWPALQRPNFTQGPGRRGTAIVFKFYYSAKHTCAADQKPNKVQNYGNYGQTQTALDSMSPVFHTGLSGHAKFPGNLVEEKKNLKNSFLNFPTSVHQYTTVKKQYKTSV